MFQIGEFIVWGKQQEPLEIIKVTKKTYICAFGGKTKVCKKDDPSVLLCMPPTVEQLAELHHQEAIERTFYEEEAREGWEFVEEPLALRGLQTYSEFLAWCAQNLEASLFKKRCGNAVVDFKKYEGPDADKKKDIIEFTLANGKKSYPFVGVVWRYFETI